jgi:hypothetical protein
VHDAILSFFNSIGGADLSARGLIAMPAHVCGGGDAVPTLDKIKVDHRLAAVRLALFTCLQTRAATNAAGGIDVKLVSEHYALPPEAPL